MGFFDILDHLLSFAAPALAVALLVTLAAPLVLPRTAQGPGWWARLAINCAAGLVTLAAGVWYFGRDGKMATYVVLVLAVATAQWLSARAWRS
ncbi:hypothetical protein [Ramlibacter sp. AN1133]|uniref:hypothetical protein n=1 Tax=Ramlibacter sp. AN1133 TaxID=3133429 RepID=UPI0030C1DBCF